MPRRAPDQVQEHRITFGNYERQFVTEVKNDIEEGVKVAVISAVAVPVAAVAGLGLLGYGIYRGLDSFGFGLNPKKWFQRQGDRLDELHEKAKGEEGGPTNIFGLAGWGIWPGVI
jgi:hypothetical protein